jgi:hypothetical protein
LGEFLVAFEIEVPFSRGGQRNNEPELRADADHLRLEAAEVVAGATVAPDLFVDVADKTNLDLLGQELRRAPICMSTPF